MQPTKQYILAFFMLFSVSIMSQDNTDSETEALKASINFQIGQADLDLNRNNWYVAEENLQKALEWAEKVGDKKIIGVINTKIAKIKYTLGESDKAISFLNKSLEIQKLTQDYVNLAETYNIRGLVLASKNEHQFAVDSYKSSKSYCELEELDEYIAEVLLNHSISLIVLKQYKRASQLLESSIALSKKFKKEILKV